MTQMNLAVKQKQACGHREQTCGSQVERGGEDGVGGRGEAEEITINRMDAQ